MPSIQQLMRVIEELPVFNVDAKLDTIIEQNRLILDINYQINRTLQSFLRKDNRNEEHAMSQMSDLVAKLQSEVADVASVKQGFETVIASLKQQLQDALNNAVSSGDMTALQQAINDIDSNVQELSNAVTANTPAASEPPVTTPVTPVTVDTPTSSDNSAPASTDTSAPSSTPVSSDNYTPPADTPTAPAPAAAVPADNSTPSTDNSSTSDSSTPAPATDTPQPADATPNTPSNS